MSIPVELSDLAQAMARFRFAYLLTGTDHGAPHAIAVTPALQDGLLVIEGVGRRTGRNLQVRAEVALVWPPLAGGRLFADRRWHGAHRGRADPHPAHPGGAAPPAPAPEPRPGSACASDCVELKL